MTSKFMRDNDGWTASVSQGMLWVKQGCNLLVTFIDGGCEWERARKKL